MSRKILYHGSSEIIKAPVYGKGKSYNDYGPGFYCIEYLEMAKEWACTEGTDGYANQYEIVTADLKILDLSEPEYTILYWLALLTEYRRIRISTPMMRCGTEWLKENFLIDLSIYDAVIGYRADDSYFAFARAFLNNEISLKQLSYAMHLGKLGEQFVLKSPKAFEAIHFCSYVMADNQEYYVKRKMWDERARAAFQAELASEDKFVETMEIIVMNKNLSTRLQFQRRMAGYSQRLLAEKSGVNLRTLQQYESGAKDINKAAVSEMNIGEVRYEREEGKAKRSL